MKYCKKILPVIIVSILATFILITGCTSGEKKSVQKYFTLDDLQGGKTIVTWTGCGYDEMIKKTFPNVKLLNGDYPSDFAVTVKKGLADAMALPDEKYYFYINDLNGITPIGALDEKAEYAAIFPRTDAGKKLVEEYNRFLADAKKNGFMQKMKDTWISPEGVKAQIDFSGLKESNPHIKFGYGEDDAPHTFRVKDKPAGYEVALVVKFCEEYGYYPEFSKGAYESLSTEIELNKLDIAVAYYEIKDIDTVYYSDPESEEQILILVQTDEKQVGFFERLKNSFKKTFIDEDRYQDFISGIMVTLTMTFGSLIFGTILGFLLYFLYRDGGDALRKVMDIIGTVLSRIPSLVILMVFFYIIFAQFKMDAVIVATITFSLLFAIQTWGNLQTSISTVPKSQRESAFILGFNKNETFFKILLPQARTVFLENYKDCIVSTMLETSAAGYIMISDVTRVGDIIKSRTYEPFLPLITVALIYLIFSSIIIAILNKVEKKTNPRERSREEILRDIDTEKCEK